MYKHTEISLLVVTIKCIMLVYFVCVNVINHKLAWQMHWVKQTCSSHTCNYFSMCNAQYRDEKDTTKFQSLLLTIV